MLVAELESSVSATASIPDQYLRHVPNGCVSHDQILVSIYGQNVRGR